MVFRADRLVTTTVFLDFDVEINDLIVPRPLFWCFLFASTAIIAGLNPCHVHLSHPAVLLHALVLQIYITNSPHFMPPNERTPNILKRKNSD